VFGSGEPVFEEGAREAVPTPVARGVSAASHRLRSSVLAERDGPLSLSFNPEQSLDQEPAS
jgi:hypothetical protein